MKLICRDLPPLSLYVYMFKLYRFKEQKLEDKKCSRVKENGERKEDERLKKKKLSSLPSRLLIVLRFTTV